MAFLDRQQRLRGASEPPGAGPRRDYPALAPLAGQTRQGYERLPSGEQRAARLLIDRELSARRRGVIEETGGGPGLGASDDPHSRRRRRAADTRRAPDAPRRARRARRSWRTPARSPRVANGSSASAGRERRTAASARAHPRRRAADRCCWPPVDLRGLRVRCSSPPSSRARPRKRRRPQRASSTEVPGIPPRYLRLYREAGARYAHRLGRARRHRQGRVRSRPGPGSVVSRSRAPRTLQGQAVRCSSSHRRGPCTGSTVTATGARDRWDPADAIFAAANYLRGSGAPGDYTRAIFAYNHSTAYVREVEDWARRYRGNGAGTHGRSRWRRSRRSRRLAGPDLHSRSRDPGRSARGSTPATGTSR